MENHETYLGKAMIQTAIGVVLGVTAASHTSMTWTIILGTLALVWCAAAHDNFNKYERRG
jgi:hypothetical protein